MNAHYCSLNHCINCGGCISSPFVKCEECRSVPTLTPSSTTDYSRKQDILLRTFVEENKALKEKLKEAKEIIGYFVDNSPASIIRVREFEKRAEKFIEDLKEEKWLESL